MRERWFADDRDLVKWSSLLHVARQHRLARILQVAYMRTDETPVVTIGADDILVDPAVWSFFRDLRRVRELGATVGIAIEVICDTFDPRHRIAYASAVVGAIDSVNSAPLLLFLDPDTGLQPLRAGAVHVHRDEVQRYWSALRAGDVLALYQHARHDTTWAADVTSELSSLCGDAVVEVARSADVGKDVALLFARKE
jgi:hypothetical protein